MFCSLCVLLYFPIAEQLCSCATAVHGSCRALPIHVADPVRLDD